MCGMISHASSEDVAYISDVRYPLHGMHVRVRTNAQGQSYE
jgi:hypothetical protein